MGQIKQVYFDIGNMEGEAEQIMLQVLKDRKLFKSLEAEVLRDAENQLVACKTGRAELFLGHAYWELHLPGAVSAFKFHWHRWPTEAKLFEVQKVRVFDITR